MKLIELRKPKEIDDFKSDLDSKNSISYRWQWSDNLEKYMNMYGFKSIGTGEYSSVFSNDQYSYIIKVFQKEPGFMTWLNFCIQNQSNIFIPKIKGKPILVYEKETVAKYSAKKIPRKTSLYAIRMEKLLPVSIEEVNTYKTYDKDSIQYLFYKHIWLFKTKKNQYSATLNQLLKSSGNDDIDSIKKILADNWTNVDMHEENIMKRNNGQIVIIDPLYYKR